jgi:hypothetical protein
MRANPMISRRLAALALVLLVLAGCHEDPTVVAVLVGPASDSLTISAVGGNTTAPALVVATAGTGGAITAAATGPMNLGNTATLPAAPALPTPPATGTELTNALITAGAPIAGNVLVSSTLQIAAGVNPAVITTNSGDVVILGSLIAERSAGAATNGIQINAPAGTIYVLGSISATGTAGAPDNPNGGGVALTATRIVVTGTIDTSGEIETAGPGGLGGAVMLDTTAVGGSFIYFTGGFIRSAGGNGVAAGGNGGAVTLQAGNKLAVYGPITTDGGSANDISVSPLGGNGGGVTLKGNGGADIFSTISMVGGASTGANDGERGGTGGTLAAGTAATYRIYGSINTSGGSAGANALGAGVLTGGPGGAVNLGLGTPLASLELGRGIYTTRGGQGVGGGGIAGLFAFSSVDGDIAMGSSLVARGGDAISPGSAAGGMGGSISITTDGAGNLNNHSLSIASLASLLDASGGAPSVSAIGGAGNSVTLQCGGNLTCGAQILTSGGGDLVTGTGGDAGPVKLLIDAAGTVPTGNLVVGGQIIAEGGTPNTSAGGNGNTIDLRIVKAGSLGEVQFSGSLSTVGGGNGGTNSAGIITISAIAGNVSLAGSISAAGRDAQASPGAGQNVVVSTPGSITSSALINASGGAGLNTAAAVPGANAGNVQFTASSAIGSVTLLAGTSITASGGAATTTAAGGIGGRILISTVDQGVSITGSITALGGASSTGPGGLGGQVVVNSDSDGNGTGGAITLTAGSVINVSGGTGAAGGFTRNNGGVAPADSSGTLVLAVVFDASSGLTVQADTPNEGVVQNLGSIIATGGSPVARGGDIWFEGKNAGGVPLTLADSGSLSLSGTLGSGAFFPN